MAKPYALPTKQLEAYNYIVSHIKKHKQSPTLQEIGDAIGCKFQNVRRLCVELETKGLITRDHHKQRSIEIVEADDE